MKKNKSIDIIIYICGTILFLPVTADAIIEVTDVHHITSTCNGSIDITAVGTAGPFTFSWTGPNNFTASTEDISNLCNPGIYTVVIGFNNSDCTISLSASVLGCSYNIDANPVVTPLCSQSILDGKVNISPQGGYWPYSFIWSNGATTEDIQNLSVGTYCVTITDGLGCKSIQHCAQVGIATPLSLSTTTIPPNTSPVCHGGPGTIFASSNGGRPPYNYLWSTGENTVFINVSTTGTYTLTLTDGCSNSVTNAVNYIIDPLINVSIQAPPSICIGQGQGNYTTISAQVTGGTPPYTYLWQNKNQSPFQYTSSLEIYNGGTYKVTVTDSYGCTNTSLTTIGDWWPPNVNLVSISNNTSFGNCQPNGSISVNTTYGLPPYQFLWTGPEGFSATTEDISNLKQGKFCLIVTDQNGCTKTSCYNIDAIGDVYLSSIKNLRLCDEQDLPCTGSVLLGTTGIGPFTYSWSGPHGFTSISNNIQDLCPGTYSVTVTGPSGCTNLLTAFVCCCEYRYHGEDPPTIPPANSCSAVPLEPLSEIIVQIVKPLTANDHTGSIDISINGGLPQKQFKWTGPGGYKAYSEDIHNLLPGTYCVTVTDGCKTKSKCITLNPCVGFKLEPSVALNCSGFSGSKTAGYIKPNPVGGDEPYLFKWNNGAVTNNLANLDLGTFSVTVTDAGGCTVAETFTLSSRKQSQVSKTFSPCQQVFICNDVTDVEPGIYYSEYINCNQFYLHCDLFPETRVGPYTQEVKAILNKEDCTIICKSGESGADPYYGTSVEDYSFNCKILNDEDQCTCLFANGCFFENVTLNGKFYPAYFVPTTTSYKRYYTTIKKKIVGGKCSSGYCYYEYYCKDRLVEEGPCFPCLALGPPKDSTYEIINKPINLTKYLSNLFEYDSLLSVGIATDVDLNMTIEDYFDFIDAKKEFEIKVINKNLLTSLENKNEYHIYPNPFSNILYVKSNKLNSNGEIALEFVNTIGVSVKKVIIPIIDHEIDFSINTYDLKKGFYSIVVSDGANLKTYKFIKINNN